MQRNGAYIPKPRPEGAALLANYKNVQSELTAPILSAGIQHVLQAGGAIARVQLFVSDQPAPPVTLDQYREKDTVEFGKLLQLVLKEQFGEAVERIEWEPIRLNPSDYNRTLPFFAERLPLLIPPDSVDVVYVAPVGGADASNVGLTINAVRCYREKCQFIYVMPDGQIHPLNLHQELLGDYARREAAAHLQRRDYAALKKTFEEAGLGRKWHLHLCDYAERRTHFDFARADKSLQEAVDTADSGQIKLEVNRLRESLKPFLKKHKVPTSACGNTAWDDWLGLQRLLLRKLFFNLKLKAEMHEWVDFLGRLFRLNEAVLRLVFELETHHSTDGNDRNGYPDFAKAVSTITDLAALGIDGRPTTYTLKKIVEYWVRVAGKNAYEAVLAFQEAAEKQTNVGGVSVTLLSLRNKSILAHGYQPVSEEDIASVIGGEDLGSVIGGEVVSLLGRVRGMLSSLKVSFSKEADPYAPVENLLQSVLK